MKFSRAYIDTFGYELPPNVISSDDIEQQLEPLYLALRFQKGQLEALTGIRERRLWDPGFKMSEGAVLAGRKVLHDSAIVSSDIEMLIYAGVCRDNFEPATACAVADGLGLGPDTQIYDVSNACLGVMNGMVQIANAIELGQIRAGMVVSCESAREILDTTVKRLLHNRDMEMFKRTVATLTGGSGAVAVLLADADLSRHGHRLIGGITRNATHHHGLCWWGPDPDQPAGTRPVMETDSIGVLENGVVLGIETFKAFRNELNWSNDQPDKIICHQVGATHQRNLLDALGMQADKDFSTFEYLGNIGTVSLPITAAIAAKRQFLSKNDLVGLLGIGSGLNCLMLGVEW